MKDYDLRNFVQNVRTCAAKMLKCRRSAFTPLVNALRSELSPALHSQPQAHSSHTEFRCAHSSAFTLAEVTTVILVMIGIILLAGRLSIGNRIKEYNAKFDKISTNISSNISQDLISKTGFEFDDYITAVKGNDDFQAAVMNNIDGATCSNCWSSGEEVEIGGKKYKNLNSTDDWKFYRLKDNSVLAVSKKNTDILVDVNGVKGPNIPDRDVRAYKYPAMNTRHGGNVDPGNGPDNPINGSCDDKIALGTEEERGNFIFAYVKEDDNCYWKKVRCADYIEEPATIGIVPEFIPFPQCEYSAACTDPKKITGSGTEDDKYRCICKVQTYTYNGNTYSNNSNPYSQDSNCNWSCAKAAKDDYAGIDVTSNIVKTDKTPTNGCEVSYACSNSVTEKSKKSVALNAENKVDCLCTNRTDERYYGNTKYKFEDNTCDWGCSTTNNPTKAVSYESSTVTEQEPTMDNECGYKYVCSDLSIPHYDVIGDGSGNNAFRCVCDADYESTEDINDIVFDSETMEKVSSDRLGTEGEYSTEYNKIYSTEDVSNDGELGEDDEGAVSNESLEDIENSENTDNDYSSTEVYISTGPCGYKHIFRCKNPLHVVKGKDDDESGLSCGCPNAELNENNGEPFTLNTTTCEWSCAKYIEPAHDESVTTWAENDEETCTKVPTCSSGKELVGSGTTEDPYKCIVNTCVKYTGLPANGKNSKYYKLKNLSWEIDKSDLNNCKYYLYCPSATHNLYKQTSSKKNSKVTIDIRRTNETTQNKITNIKKATYDKWTKKYSPTKISCCPKCEGTGTHTQSYDCVCKCDANKHPKPKTCSSHSCSQDSLTCIWTVGECKNFSGQIYVFAKKKHGSENKTIGKTLKHIGEATYTKIANALPSSVSGLKWAERTAYIIRYDGQNATLLGTLPLTIGSNHNVSFGKSSDGRFDGTNLSTGYGSSSHKEHTYYNITGYILWDGCRYDIKGGKFRESSPIVLDFKGDGFKYTSVDDGANFDIDADGNMDRTGWTARQEEFDDAFLVLDKNGDGQVNSGAELFGDQNGEENGYKELAKYDDNKDGKIDKNDAVYSQLRLWADMNGDGKVNHPQEWKTLAEMGVTEISVKYEKAYDSNGNSLTDEHGNDISLQGTFKRIVSEVVDGIETAVEKVGQTVDVFFNYLSNIFG